jgi:hypothetical protein
MSKNEFLPLTDAHKEFLDAVAFPNLNRCNSDDALKHIADVWWNLCLWEQKRSDVLDTKAQNLLGLASIASALVAVAGPIAGTSPITDVLRISSVIGFLVTAILAILALRVSAQAGFYDKDVFDALSLHDVAGNPAMLHDPDPFRCYLRDIAAQRWVIYSGFMSASSTRAKRVENAQLLAVTSLALFVVAIVCVRIGV